MKAKRLLAESKFSGALKWRIALIALFIVSSTVCLSQSIILGDDATFILGDQATFYAGGNTTLSGSFDNQGTIISYSDLDVKGNTRMNGLRFVGPDDQVLRGDDTLRVKNLTLEKTGDLNLEVTRLIVEDNLDLITGVLGAGADTTLLVSGNITGGSNDGFIEGKLIHLTKSDEVFFPLGINGFYNALTLTGVPGNTVIVVEVRVPDPAQLLPTEDMVGIADEVEWAITAMGEPFEVRASAIFNGIDLTQFSNGQEIRADGYAPSLVKYGINDTIYVDLGLQDPQNIEDRTSGTVDSESTFFISEEPTLISVALIPLLLEPEFYVPNAFSPTGTIEENRIFRPYFAGGSISFFSIQIWDKFQKDMYSFSETGVGLNLSGLGWDGRLSNGEIADEGVYYFSISVIADDIRYDKTGSFLLAN